MKAKDFNVLELIKKTYKKTIYGFQSVGEFKNLPKVTILQTKPRVVLAGNVVDFMKERENYINKKRSENGTN